MAREETAENEPEQPFVYPSRPAKLCPWKPEMANEEK